MSHVQRSTQMTQKVNKQQYLFKKQLILSKKCKQTDDFYIDGHGPQAIIQTLSRVISCKRNSATSLMSNAPANLKPQEGNRDNSNGDVQEILLS